jgi:hypothetical protein
MSADVLKMCGATTKIPPRSGEEFRRQVLTAASRRSRLQALMQPKLERAARSRLHALLSSQSVVELHRKHAVRKHFREGVTT